MRGQVTKRGASWTYIVDVPPSPAQRCTECNKRHWVAYETPAAVCPHCGGAMGDPTPERRQMSRGGFRTRKECEAALRETLGEVEQGADPFPKDMTARAYFAKWLEYQESRLRPRTHARYVQLVRLHILPVIGDHRLSDLRPPLIASVLQRMLEAGLADQTVVNVHAVMGGALTTALEWQLIRVNPVRAVKRPKVERFQIQTPTAEQATALLAASVGSQWEIPILLSLGTGARRGEVLALRWADLDLDKATASISRSLQQLNTKLWYGDVKTGGSNREAPLPAFVVERLRQHRREQAKRRLLLGPDWNAGDLVCETGDGSPLQPDSYSRAFRRIAAKVGLSMRLHDARHTYATLQIAGGVHPAVVSRALGHSSPAFTAAIYQHVAPSHTQAAAAVIDAALRGG